MSTAHEPATATHVYGPPVVVEVKVTVKALAFRESDGGFSIVVPELPGCVSEGDTLEEASGNIVEAAEGWLAAGHDENRERSIRMTTDPMPSERESSE